MSDDWRRCLGRQCDSDGWFKKRARKLQSMYRADKEKDFDVDRNDQLYGNRFAENAPAGLNFLSESIFKYVSERIKKKTKWETIEPHRMLKNALSSQPMAFNLFVPLRELLDKGYGKQLTTFFRKALCLEELPEEALLTDITPEFIPNYDELSKPYDELRKVYDVDKTAMDVKLEFEGEDRKRYLVAVEVKYTDKLGKNTSDKHRVILEELKDRFETDKPNMDQLMRNYLMCEECRVIFSYEACFCRVLTPHQYKSDKKATFQEVELFNKQLKEHFIKGVKLENFVDALVDCDWLPEDDRKIFEAFWDRYLNFDKLDET